MAVALPLPHLRDGSCSPGTSCLQHRTGQSMLNSHSLSLMFRPVCSGLLALQQLFFCRCLPCDHIVQQQNCLSSSVHCPLSKANTNQHQRQVVNLMSGSDPVPQAIVPRVALLGRASATARLQQLAGSQNPQGRDAGAALRCGRLPQCSDAPPQARHHYARQCPWQRHHQGWAVPVRVPSCFNAILVSTWLGSMQHTLMFWPFRACTAHRPQSSAQVQVPSVARACHRGWAGSWRQHPAPTPLHPPSSHTLARRYPGTSSRALDILNGAPCAGQPTARAADLKLTSRGGAAGMHREQTAQVAHWQGAPG